MDKRFYGVFAGILTRNVKKYAKIQSRKAFGRYDRHTPFYAFYSKRNHTLTFTGNAPNINVKKQFGAPKRVKIIGKRKPALIQESVIIYGRERKKGFKGLWFTPKTKEPDMVLNGKQVFVTKSSHSEITIGSKSGRPWYARSNGRKYPFPPMWYAQNDGTIDYATGAQNVADVTFSGSEIDEIIAESFMQAAKKSRNVFQKFHRKK